MTRFLLLRVAVTLMTVAGIVASLIMPTYRLPFEREAHGRFATVSARPDAKLPADLRAGDRTVFSEQSARARAVLVSPDIPPDASYDFVIHRGSAVVHVAVSTVPSPDDGNFLWVVNLMTVCAISLLGLLTLWRGTSWAAWGLTLFAEGVLCGSTVAQLPVPPFANIAANVAGFLMTGPMPLLGLLLMALDLTGRSAASRPRLMLLFAAAATGLFILEVLAVIDMLVFGFGGGVTTISLLSGVCAAVMVALPLGVLGFGYVAAGAEQKLRIRWVLASTAMLIPLFLAGFIDQLHLTTSVAVENLLTLVRALLTGLIFSLFAYAVLSQRLVEVRIVINRALVFGALMMMVVGVLGAAENLIERTALGASASEALELVVPLALGVLFNRLHRWIEGTVDRLLFRSEHLSRAALRDFVRDAGFIETADTLVRRMVSTFGKHAGGHGAALFELRGREMECSAKAGDFAWPELIDVDDPALVRLRATLSPLDLHETESAFGADGLALPLALRGRLFGVLVCGPRPAGRYAQTEAAELGQAAHEVGASLFAVRARANEVLIEKLAQGQLEVSGAVVEARRLVGMA